MPASDSFAFTIQLSAGNAIDPSSGTLCGVTVAEVGVATGHFAFLDKDNRVLGVGGLDDASNFRMAARKVPLCMDEKSLDTVIAAATKAKRVKAREDHDDSVGARAGFVDNFRIEGQKVVCDATIFDGYRNRAVFIETAQETPELIGLSGDFRFLAEVIGDAAFMRIIKVEAVDIVDRGALTHAGLFKAKSTDAVDNQNQSVTQHATMATKHQEPDGDEMPDLGAFKTMCEQLAAYRAKHAAFATSISEAMAAINPVTVPTPKDAPAPVADPASDKDASVADPKANFAALKDELVATMSAKVTEAVAATKAELLEFRKQMSALGIKPEAKKEPTADELAVALKAKADADAAAAAASAPSTDPVKAFLSLKASIATERKIKPADATHAIIKEQPAVYKAYLTAKKIIA